MMALIESRTILENFFVFTFLLIDWCLSYNHDQDIALRCGFARSDGHPDAVCPQRSGKCPNGKW